ncbi:hypothetical protein BV25DRAFT_1841171 [Artomyces pyxidatus]|uniref:Uncharacterized protein n=1 Tax=Artomyces pyxidatus TaxID=48021 RepID=A0ACB8SP90_9AGAM|nr:hypothetical protein BV25DRAFT_1841171 [Artomyces pyxidatus]
MNALWSLLSHYLLSIRIYNDLEDFESDDGTASDDSYPYELPTTNRYQPTTPYPLSEQYRPTCSPPPPIPPPSVQQPEPYSFDPFLSAHPHGQYHDRMSDVWPEISSTTCEPPRTPGEGLQLQEQLRARGVELWNMTLMNKLKKLEAEMADIQGEASAEREELCALRVANEDLARRNDELASEIAEANAWSAQAQPPVGALPSVRPAEDRDERDEELAALRSFHDKTDDITGTEVVQAVQDINTEIMQLAAAVSEEFPLSRHNGGLWTESDCEFVREAIGDGMLQLLRDGSHEEDPTVVQLAVQAWQVWSCRQILESFCFGVFPEADRFLEAVFRNMQLSESQAMTSRWRALTHKHARSISSDFSAPALVFSDSGSGASSSLASPISFSPRANFNAYPTPMSTTNNTPALPPLHLPLAQKRSISISTSSSQSTGGLPSHAAHNMRGLRAILALAGCTDPGARREPLRERFGDAVAHILERAEKLAHDVRESVSSAWFEVRIESAPAQAFLGGMEGPRAKMYDPATMQNVYAGYGDENAPVLCTVAFGLEVVKTRRGGAVAAGEDHPQDFKEAQESALERTLLLKPQVILESVKDLL